MAFAKAGERIMHLSNEFRRLGEPACGHGSAPEQGCWECPQLELAPRVSLLPLF